MAKRLNADQALDKLMHTPKKFLMGWVYASSKDFYGVHGSGYNTWTKEELVSWIVSHFSFDEKHQNWKNKVPFIEY